MFSLNPDEIHLSLPLIYLQSYFTSHKFANSDVKNKEGKDNNVFSSVQVNQQQYMSLNTMSMITY